MDGEAAGDLADVGLDDAAKGLEFEEGDKVVLDLLGGGADVVGDCTCTQGGREMREGVMLDGSDEQALKLVICDHSLYTGTMGGEFAVSGPGLRQRARRERLDLLDLLDRLKD